MCCVPTIAEHSTNPADNTQFYSSPSAIQDLTARVAMPSLLFSMSSVFLGHLIFHLPPHSLCKSLCLFLSPWGCLFHILKCGSVPTGRCFLSPLPLCLYLPLPLSSFLSLIPSCSLTTIFSFCPPLTPPFILNLQKYTIFLSSSLYSCCPSSFCCLSSFLCLYFPFSAFLSLLFVSE